MALGPVEIRHLALRRTLLFGYRRRDVDQFLAEIADSFQDLYRRRTLDNRWRERTDVAVHPRGSASRGEKPGGPEGARVFSDLSGQAMDAGDAATVTISYADSRRGQVVLNVLASEIDDLARRGKRGRCP
jgi:DivIVA domain-containing protein